MAILENPIEYLKGVGPTRAELLKKELSIYTFSDLLYHFPFRYIDKSLIYNICDLSEDLPYIQLRGKIIKFEEKGKFRSKRLIAYFQDDTGIIELVWFKGHKWIKENLKINNLYVIFGKTNWFNGQFSMPHPEMETLKTYEKKVA